MIYEFRTYTLFPRALPEFMKRWTDMLDARLKLSPLAAFWYTEIGPLNQVIHVWPYENTLERTRIRAEAIKMGIWPPKTTDLISNMRSEIFEPLPFSPRHWLGDALLELKRFDDAERVYRDDLKEHPKNGWSLFGLKQALAGRGESTAEVDAELAASWARSDTWIRSSRF